jgi:hypothetical protein
MTRFVGAGLLASLSSMYLVQPPDTLTERLDVALRAAVPGAVLERVQPPSLHSSQTYLAWRYDDALVTVQYSLAASLEEAKDTFAKTAMVLPVGTASISGIVGDDAFLVGRTNGPRRLHFRRDKLHVQVGAPATPFRPCFLTGGPPEPCSPPARDPLIRLPPAPELKNYEFAFGYETVIRFALLFDAEVSRSLRASRRPNAAY